MASEYLKWKYRDVPPDTPSPLTGKEKRRNWWHYHKWHVVIGALLLAIAVDIGKDALGIGKLAPDYQAAYVGSSFLPEDTVAALEASLAALGEDCNGDGQVVVRLHQYVEADAAQDVDNAYYTYASEVTLLADLEDCDSYFFLLEEPDGFQADYQVLSLLDGSLPEGTAKDAAGCCLRWTDCPALRGLPLGGYSYEVAGQAVHGDSQELLSRLYLARRGFWGDRTADNMEGCDALWNTLTKGAAS